MRVEEEITEGLAKDAMRSSRSVGGAWVPGSGEAPHGTGSGEPGPPGLYIFGFGGAPLVGRGGRVRGGGNGGRRGGAAGVESRCRPVCTFSAWSVSLGWTSGWRRVRPGSPATAVTSSSTASLAQSSTPPYWDAVARCRTVAPGHRLRSCSRENPDGPARCTAAPDETV